MEESGEPLLTVTATCSMFWVYTWTSRHWKVTARRAVETSDAADTMTQLPKKKKEEEEKRKKKKKRPAVLSRSAARTPATPSW
jgi:hypothetical protein